MQEVSLTTFLSIICFFLCLLLSLFLFSVKSNNKTSNKLLIAFLFLIAVEYSTYFHNLYITTPFHNFVIAKSCLEFLQMPVFYLYILSVCYSDFVLKPKHLFHLIPYVIVNIVLYPRFYSLSVSELLKIWEDYNYIWEIRYFHTSIHLQFIIYIILVFLVLKKYKKIYLQNFSNSASKTYKWLFQFALALTLLRGIVFIQSILKYVNETNYLPYMQIIRNLAGLFVICWYVLKALKHPDLFNTVNSKTQVIVEDFPTSTTKNTDKIDKLNSFMESKKPYLNPSLSIGNLAQEIKINSRELSILINQNLNKHFFDFVNEYRIEDAKNILNKPSKKELTVLEILYEVGFNSKSSFNTAFKKHTGTTPTQYRKQFYK
jgi:AraC-like DNA-binding protein